MIRFPKEKNKIQIINYFKNHGLLKILKINTSEFDPNFSDLYRLHQFIILNKRTTVLEFGSGWSSLIMQHALNINRKKFAKDILPLRRGNPFELFVIENKKKYLNITKKRSIKYFKNLKRAHFFFSECQMTTFNKKFACEYKKIPKCNPDFIYLDGPNPFTVIKNVYGFNLKHKDLMPMSCDILKFEHFLVPGTIIVVDGRTANATFLKKNFQRKWKYKHDKKNDQSIFVLMDKSLGPINDLQLKFYKRK